MAVKGVVEKITPRGKAWDVYVNGERYGAGFAAPTYAVGDYITFETKDVEFKGKTYKNIDVDSVVVSEAPAEAKPKAAKAVDTQPAAESKPTQSYWDNKDKRISYAGCQEDAIAIVGLALQYEAISLGAAKNKRLGLLVSYVNQVSEDLFNRVQSMDYDNPVVDDSKVDAGSDAVSADDDE